jgi:DNA primase
MIASHLDFKILKNTVSISQVLAAKGLTNQFKKRGDRLFGPCPIHGGDNPSAFVVSISKNQWYCFSQCRTGGDVIELVRRLDHLSYRQTAARLASLTSLSPLSPMGQSTASSAAKPHADRQSRQEHPSRRVQPFRPYTRRLFLDPDSPFLQQKGISTRTARAFEAGVYHGPGFLQDCIGVRLHDSSGKPLGYLGRRLDRQQAMTYGKWKLPSRLPKRQILYGFHRVANFLHRALCIVECPWGVMRLHQLGVPAVALLGAYLSEPQRQLLTTVKRVVIILDGDSTGRTASTQVKESLIDTTDVKIVNLPDNLDPDELSDQEFKSILSPLSLC